ncbi:MAG: hypothetical protein IKF97_04905 [Clostridia bacterium]|nr:hypothetical protein [Clostridia bacterium]
MEQLQESFFNKYSDDFLGFIQDYTKNKLESREDYKSIKEKITKIKEDNPKLRLLDDTIEDDAILEFNHSEKNYLIKMMMLDDELQEIEKKEIFKLGFKEALIFFNEMGFLNFKNSQL